ncbi:MAG: hypothetical protein J0H68_05530 [Sphingobacteriia bacterium]|nr:hypothetical protein [Sphingobacteriia bacterium]
MLNKNASSKKANINQIELKKILVGFLKDFTFSFTSSFKEQDTLFNMANESFNEHILHSANDIQKQQIYKFKQALFVKFVNRVNVLNNNFAQNLKEEFVKFYNIIETYKTRPNKEFKIDELQTIINFITATSQHFANVNAEIIKHFKTQVPEICNSLASKGLFENLLINEPLQMLEITKKVRKTFDNILDVNTINTMLNNINKSLNKITDTNSNKFKALSLQAQNLLELKYNINKLKANFDNNIKNNSLLASSTKDDQTKLLGSSDARYVKSVVDNTVISNDFNSEIIQAASKVKKSGKVKKAKRQKNVILPTLEVNNVNYRAGLEKLAVNPHSQARRAALGNKNIRSTLDLKSNSKGLTAAVTA